MSESSKNKTCNQLDDLVQYITLHTLVPCALSLSILPFVIFYVFWFYMNIGVFIEGFGSDELSDTSFFLLLGVAFLQLIVNLCCFWNVHIKTFLHCRKVSLLFHLKK